MRPCVGGLANVFAAYRWCGLLRAHHTSAMEFPTLRQASPRTTIGHGASVRRPVRLRWTPVSGGLQPGANVGPMAQARSGRRLFARLPSPCRPAATSQPGHLLQVIRHGLKKIQYRPGLIEGCLAGTGLALEPGETPTTSKIMAFFPCYLLAESGPKQLTPRPIN